MKSLTTINDIVVIGGGAAGMLAAVIAAEGGGNVTLLEKNAQLGRKLNITGKGRCNLTNNCDLNTLLSNIPQNARFLYSAFSHFSPQDTMAFFEKLGVKLKTERGARVFPISDQAREVTEALRRAMKQTSVTVLNAYANDIRVQDGAVCAVVTDKGDIVCSKVLIATGGLSYPVTGSTGDGFEIAQKLGHTIITPKASLVPLIADRDTCAKMQGLTLKNVVLRVLNSKNKCIFSGLGEMLFTHFGVSGPLILSASAHMRDMEKERYILSIDLKPGLDEDKLDARILRDFEERKNRDIINALGGLLPSKMIPVVVARLGIPSDIKVNSIDKKTRRLLVKILKNFLISVQAKRPIAEAVITTGGIKISEIDPKTMQSKLINGLYFAGEVIDVDAYTGGFNLQIAWSTAYAAGMSMSNQEGI